MAYTMRGAVVLSIFIFMAELCTCTAFIPPTARFVESLIDAPAPSSVSRSRNGAETRLQQVGAEKEPVPHLHYPTLGAFQSIAAQAPEGSLVLIEVTKKNARVYKSMAKGSVPEVIQPVDEWRLHETGNTEHRSQGFVGHQSEQEDQLARPSYLIKFYMDKLLETITNADSVLLVGHGQGKSNLAEGLASAIYIQHPTLTEKIENVLRLDGKHITQNQLLALGRRHLLHAEDPRKPV